MSTSQTKFSETSPVDRARIFAEESYRLEVQRQLKPPESKRPWLTENSKWIAATILIPVISVIGAEYKKRIEANRQQQETERRGIEQKAETERLNIKNKQETARANGLLLLPLIDRLSEPGNADRQVMALSVLNYLGTDTLPHEIVEAISARVNAASKRFDGRVATDADTALLTIVAEGQAKASGEGALAGNDQKVRSAEISILSTISLPPRVYIHIFDEFDRPLMQLIADELKTKKILVPGIQNVVMTSNMNQSNNRPKPEKTASVRYFKEDDKLVADEVIRLFSIKDRRKYELVYLPKLESKVRPGHIEVWLTKR